MEATQSLDRDHRIIETVLPALERLGRQAEGMRLRQREEAEAAVGFLRTFVDAYHHGKEEQHLFKVMEERGVPRDGGLILHLLKEHGDERVPSFLRAKAFRERGRGFRLPMGYERLSGCSIEVREPAQQVVAVGMP